MRAFAGKRHWALPPGRVFSSRSHLSPDSGCFKGEPRRQGGRGARFQQGRRGKAPCGTTFLTLPKQFSPTLTSSPRTRAYLNGCTVCLQKLRDASVPKQQLYCMIAIESFMVTLRGVDSNDEIIGDRRE